MKEKNIVIDVWSDFVCPFCYIGNRKLEEALKKFNLLGQVEINYKSLELDTAKEHDKKADPIKQFADKYEMPLGKADRVMEKTAEKVEAAGLVYNYKTTVSANTFDAHRLNYYAKEFNKDEAMTQGILQAHFVDNLDIQDQDVLANLAEDIGLKKEEVMDMFKSDKYYDVIEADRKLAIELQIDVVPTYIINNEHRIAGVLDSEDYERILRKVTNNM